MSHSGRKRLGVREITSLSFQLHRVIYVSLTQKCPLRCAHCFVESGPERTEHADLEDFRRWIDSLVAAPSVEVVALSGGEPWSHPAALRYAIDACFRAEVYSMVCTSGFWAATPEKASRLLDSYPRPNGLCLSTDVFHEPFVPLRHLRYAVEAAVERGIEVMYQIVDDDPEGSEFMQRFEREVGFDLVGREQVYVVNLAAVGRAAEELSLSRPSEGNGDLEHIPDGPCPWLGAPWLHEDGVVCACSNLEVHRTPDHPLQLGHLNEVDFPALSAATDADPYVQALRILGPRGLVEELPVESWGWDRAAFRGGGVCDLCHSLARVPGLPDRVREAAGREHMASRIAAFRMMVYGETGHLREAGAAPASPEGA